MSKRSVIQILALIFTFLCTKQGATQNVLGLSPGAKGGSMGSIRTTHQDILAMYGNEAGLASLDQLSAYASVEHRFQSEGLGFLSLVAALPTEFGTFGIALFHHGFDLYSEQLVGLAYARKLLDVLSIGTQFDFVRVRIPTYGATSTFTAEIGIQSTIFDDLLLGFHVCNPFIITWADGESLPSSFSLGLSYQPTDKVWIAAEVQKVSNHVENVKFGIDYRLIRDFNLRIGFSTNPAQISFGIGYLFDSEFSFDLGSAFHQELGFSPLGGIGYQKSD